MRGLEKLWQAHANAALAGVLEEGPAKTAIAAHIPAETAEN
jgi:hypothetical protein